MVPASAARALYGALLLAAACSLDGRLRFVGALPLVACAFAASYAALSQTAADTSIAWQRPVLGGLASLAALGVVLSDTNGALWFELTRRGFSLLAIPLLGVAFGSNERQRRRMVDVLLAGAVVVALLTPLGTPNPQIDVVTWTAAALDALLGGAHPYTAHASDVYEGSRDFGFTVTVYPYMPATLLALAPWAAAFGDYRVGLALCLPLTVWLLRTLARDLGSDRRFADAAILAVALHPSSATMVRSGWTEPLLVTAAAAFACFAVRRPCGGAQAAAFFLQPALKQYVAAPVLLYLAAIDGRCRRRALAIGALVGAATVAPFLLWNAAATMDGIFFQLRAPTRPRLSAISIPGVLAASGLSFPPAWASVAAQIAASALVWRRCRQLGTAGILLGSAFALLATFLAGWQAFINYYYYVGALLAIAAILLTATGEGRT